MSRNSGGTKDSTVRRGTGPAATIVSNSYMTIATNIGNRVERKVDQVIGRTAASATATIGSLG